jgi:hypothetical protein
MKIGDIRINPIEADKHNEKDPFKNKLISAVN